MSTVIYQPTGEEIGAATTRAGAIRHAHRIPKLPRERWSATLTDRLIEPDDPADEIRFEPMWFVSAVLR